MRWRMKHKIRSQKIVSGLFVLILVACSRDAELKMPNAEEITRIGNGCEDIEQGQIIAWNTRNADNLRQIYTDDIVHFDGEPAYEGIDEVVDMAKQVHGMFPDWQMQAGGTYISKDKCFGTWINWEIIGLTQENPGIEFDLLETQDNKISFWRLFYDQNFGFSEIDYELLSQFGEIWSQGDANKIKELYSEDATLEDTLFGISVNKQSKIADYAESIFAKSPGASWKLLIPFAEGRASYPYSEQHPFASQGGVFVINVNDSNGDPCEIQTVVILTLNIDGRVQAQETFYDANSLITCDWLNVDGRYE